jgi:hypothetical protein
MADKQAHGPHPTRYSCPYVGLAVEPTVRLAEATPAHCCFARATPGAPGVEHQQRYCLTVHHPACPSYLEPAAPNVASVSQLAGSGAHMPPVQVKPQAQRPFGASVWRLPIILLGTLGLLLIVAVLFRMNLVVGQHRDHAIAPTGTLATDLPEISTPSTAQPVTQRELLTTPTPVPVQALVLLPTVTPQPTAGGFTLAPKTGNSSWWSSGADQRGRPDDSFLYAGYRDGETYIAAMRFDVSRIPRGAEIRQAQLQLVGLRVDRFVADPNATWWVEVLAENALDRIAGSDFLTVFSAPASLTLKPARAADLAAGTANRFDFDELARAWLAQQLLNGSSTVTFRLRATTQGVNTLFGWDSGFGPETAGKAPTLAITIGPPPPTPPPLPTLPVIVATFTPIPQNVLTVVALNETATYVATTVGTHTPMPWAVVTPTAFPANLETVQAAALVQELPAVVPHTPTPANEATAIYVAAVATAVAQTTGTYTPVPEGYVTPMLIYPSPPPENILTAVARQTEVAAAALIATPTPLPFNGVIAEYVIATATPENVLTAAVMVATATAQATGTPQPPPWNRVILQPTPLPVTPTPTATPFVELLPLTLTPVPTPTPLPPLGAVPATLSNHVLFKTNRNGWEEILAVNMATYQLSRINDVRIYELAVEQLPLSPDGNYELLVEADEARLLQIKRYSFEYNDKQQLTHFGPTALRAEPTSYDPAWSPTGGLIVFVSNSPGNDEIFTMDPAGQSLTQLTMNRTEWDKHPSWSPDGSRIVFYSNRDIGLRRLWTMNVDGSGQREISTQMQPPPVDPEFEDWDPIWVR